MFRIVRHDDEGVNSPDSDGLLVPEDMEDDPDDPSAEYGRSSSTVVTENSLHSKEHFPSSHSTTSLASALQASLGSASLREEFHECLADDDDVNEHVVSEGNPLLNFLAAACDENNDDIDDDGFDGEERLPFRAKSTSVLPIWTAPEDGSERESVDGTTSDAVVPAPGASSLQVNVSSARSVLSRGASLVASAAGLAIRTAFLPVTLPLHLTGSVIGRVVGSADDYKVSSPSIMPEDEEDESSDVSTQPAAAEGHDNVASSDEPSNYQLNGSDESSVGAWTVPLETAMKLAFLPVTAPMFLATAATSVAVSGCSAAVSTTAALLEQALHMGSGAISSDVDASDEKDSSCAKQSVADDRCNQNPEPEVRLTERSDKLIAPPPPSHPTSAGIFGLSESLKDVTVKVLTDLSFLLDSLSPSLRDTLIDPREEDQMLDRLRLDFHLVESPRVLDAVADPVLPVTPACSFYSAASSVSDSCEPRAPPMLSAAEPPCPRPVAPLVSSALLRVDDLGIYRMDPAKETMLMSRLFYLDLNDDLGTELGDEAMSRLIGRCLGFISNIPEARLQSTMHHHVSPKAIVDWKPERGSSDLIGRLSKLTNADRVAELQSKTLVWSGQFRHPDGRGNKPFPLFASRGIIPWKPLDFVSLMWDDARVQVYNKLCAGRSSVRVFRDEIDSGGSRGTKIVSFTTRVPLTNFTVSMTSLMHIAPILTRNEDDAFIIISRSILSGRSGSHFESHDHVERAGNKSEIIWGVNIVQPVPNAPHLTDLTSISQVGTTMVPNLLARKIGLWGVEDFYKNVRNHNS